ncbi:MAG: hypothetical protein Ct9H300mP21_04030 [Pseudomonadota bacterium]|nr:MAG: hypothetical protein Ct9H300mP21_04030 [Pseudomonadota bacterium]
MKRDKPTLNQQKERSVLLRVRSELPILENNVSAEIPDAPTDGTPPMRFRFGVVSNSLLGPALEVGAWANYHVLLGDESGHLQNAEVVTLDLHLQLRKNFFEVTQFQLFNIKKFLPSIQQGFLEIMNGHGVRVEVGKVNILVAYPAENLA